MTSTGYYYDTWGSWTSNSTTATATNYTTTSTVWVSWTTSTASTSAVWNCWSSDAGSVTYTQTAAPYQETDEERHARERREAEARREQQKVERERKAKQEAADKKAKELLKEVLDDNQKRELDSKDEFTLTVVGSKNRYRIRKGDCRNIDKLDATGKVIETLCFHPDKNIKSVPHYDTMAIQKLMLENYEDEARKVANIQRY
jgi:hypothetical protein